MEKQETYTQGLSTKFFGLYWKIAGGEKALVESLLSQKSKEVVGPKLVNKTKNIRLFTKEILAPGDKIEVVSAEGESTIITQPGINYIHPDDSMIEYEKAVLEEGEKGWKYDQTGNFQEIEGPGEFHIHPEGKLVQFRKIQISEREAIVVVGEDGKEQIIEGKNTPEYLLNPAKESLKVFSWTGSGENGPTSEKVPNAISFNKIRLDDSQTYFSFPVRTKDNVVINLHLMLFYKISNLQNLVKNTHDPFSEFYNKIQSEVGKAISQKSFDEFKENTNKQVSNIEFLQQDSFDNIGLKIDKVAVREWLPKETDVQRILERSAMVQSQKTLDLSEHERKMAQISYDEKEQDEKKKLAKGILEDAKIRGQQESTQLSMIFQGFEKLAGGKAEAISLMKLYLAKDANELNIGSEMLK